ncbi:hypothetical protein [Bradyrhizobium japonicum]|uniref:hypothetical protein n=1 Tax=Bradyrhizobium japonicum TaxID=375 RepID=UPI000462CA8F|nr:hypothetical protein [Bradyrhizobium japonicum]
MTDTVKHMWDQVEKARADGTFSSEHAAVPAQCDAASAKLLAIANDLEACQVFYGPAATKPTDLKFVAGFCISEKDQPLIVGALRAAARSTPAEVVHPDDFAQFLRDVEREQGNCSDEDTWLGYRQTAEAILEKFDVRPKHSSTVSPSTDICGCGKHKLNCTYPYHPCHSVATAQEHAPHERKADV